MLKFFIYIDVLILLSACVSVGVPPDLVQHQTVRIVAVGDVFMGGTSVPTLMKEGYDYPFEKTKHLFKHADVALANLEGSLTQRKIFYKGKQYTFSMPPDKVASALHLAGFHMLTLANNHTMDFGLLGLKDTTNTLEKYKLAHVGAGQSLDEARQPYIFERDGFKVGFLAYSVTFPEDFWATETKGGTVFAYEEYIRQDIRALITKVDSVVVSFHWGKETETELRPYQIRLGHIAIDEGAALIIGHHPHVMQGIERYKKGLILYSLGNYVFGSYSNNVQYGGLAKVTLGKHGFRKLSLTLLDINNFKRNFQPSLLDEKAMNAAFLTLKGLSSALGTYLKLVKGEVVIE